MWEELPGAMGEGRNHSGVSVREWPLLEDWVHSFQPSSRIPSGVHLRIGPQRAEGAPAGVFT